MKSGGGFKAIKYSFNVSTTIGFKKLYQAMFSKNTCKTCALGMGGQKGGMTDESGRFPEVCKKSFQAQLSDIQVAIPEKIFTNNSIDDFRKKSARLLERCGRLNSPLYKAEGDSYYSTIPWDEAITKAAEGLKASHPANSFYIVLVVHPTKLHIYFRYLLVFLEVVT